MKIGRKKLLALVAVGAGLSLGVHAASAQQTTTPLTQEQIKQIVASPDRSAADRTNDRRRKPEEMLVFIGIHPGITALDLSAAGGYTTELLARKAPGGSTRWPTRSLSFRPALRRPASVRDRHRLCPSAPRPSPEALADRESALRSAGIKAAPITAVILPFENPVPPELAPFDLVTLMFNYHDLGHLGVDRAAMNRAVFQALKPGGFYVIADHSGRPGTGISEAGTLHRVEEAFLRKEVEAAGFKLAAEGNFLRNPNDPRDKNTPDPPQPKDEFVLKFVKP